MMMALSDSPLSPRESEVVLLVAKGMTNAEIGHELGISKRTVDSHLDHIKSKLGLTRRAQIVAWAVDRT
jgi:DNA-binding CsgD family transcriptional regulator